MHDPITGLPNRGSIEDEFLSFVEQHENAAVLVLRVENRDAMIRTLGHAAGDQLLKDITARLSSITRGEADLLGHIEGSTFALVVSLSPENGHHVDDVSRLGTRLLGALRNDFRLSGVKVSTLASVGVALYPDHGATLTELLPKAIGAIQDPDIPGLVNLHDPATEVDSPEQLSMLGQLRDAIDSGQLEVHYQPKLDASSEIVIGVEALVRWSHPDKGLIPPAQFIPLAETTGLVVPMTWVVLDQALTQVNVWRRRGWALRVSVNVAAEALVDPTTPMLVEQALTRHKVPAQLLMLEVTESSLIKDPHRATATITQLREIGVAISVDDYGTGYSSLSYLQKLHADELKIDRAFVKNLGNADNSHDLAIVETTVNLGHRLGMHIVAEGVQTQIERDILEASGCDAIQGFLYSKPLPAPELTTWLTQRVVKPWIPDSGEAFGREIGQITTETFPTPALSAASPAAPTLSPTENLAPACGQPAQTSRFTSKL